MIKSFAKLIVAGAALVAASSMAHALLVTAGIAPGNFTFTAPSVLVPINGASTSVGFTLGAPQRLIITFSAECAVNAAAGSNGAWVDIDVRMDGVALAPTNTTFDAFCSSNGTAGFDGWTRASITVPVTVAAGAHSVTILARLNNGATGGWISDRALVIER